MARVSHASASSRSAFAMDKSSSSGSSLWWRPWALLSPTRLLSCLVPSAASPLELLERLVLYPLELYESIVILPVGFVRRHMPVVGGTLVVLMTLHGILLRLFLEGLRSLFARITTSKDVRFNYNSFWLAMRDRYAFFLLRGTDWNAVHRVFGEPLATTTSDDDLWMALQESIAVCDDPALRVTRPLPGSGAAAGSITAFGRPPLAAQRIQYEAAAMNVMRHRHLTDGGRQITNHFVYGILNAETSPGWRIGYLAMNAMDGFVDFPLPRLDALGPLWSQEPTGLATTTPGASKSVAVPEIYDLESMRWALEAVLKALGDVDALILDLRFNRGGGSLVSALSVASFFTGPKKSLAFLTDEKVPSSNANRFSKKRKHYVPSSKRTLRYSGPLVVLQSQYTRGTAEILSLSLMNRPQTCRVGTRSAGTLTQTRKLRLPNCWTVDLPYLRCFSADGELYEDKGVPVDKTVDNMEDAVLFQMRATPNSVEEPVVRDLFDPCIKTAIDHIMNV